MLNKFKKKNSGFTLVETLVGVAVFLVVALASYQAYVSLFSIVSANQYKILALGLANEQFEIIRNMPYADIGVVNGIPNGKIPYQQTLVRGGITFTVTAIIRNIDQAYDGKLGGAPNDTSPADNKFIDITVTCSTCKNFNSIELTTNVAPKNLETASTNGAITIKVFDANGVALKDADVNITRLSGTPAVNIQDITDANGSLQVVDAPPGSNLYRVTVTKSGYSTERTYPPGATGNPTPTKPDLTVLLQQITPVSFSIDKLSTLSFSSVTNTCSPVPNIDFTLVGSKTIGTNVPKYNATLATDSSGKLTLANTEWDTYTVSVNDDLYDLIGLSPLNSIALNPDSTQSIQLVMALKNAKSLLVTVKDSATQLPLTDSTVVLTNGAYSSTKTTNRGYLIQTDWSGGSGQQNMTNASMYANDDGNVSVTSPVGDLKLKNVFGSYVASGILESSIFDTGSASNFHNISWLPVDQPSGAGSGSVKFQIATSATSTPESWNYKGPDGTSGTYYTTSGTTLNSVHNGDEFLRYKVFLATTNGTYTPNLSDISFTFTSSCTPPGQVIFTGLASGTYTLNVGKTGYATTTMSVPVSTAWKEQAVLLGP